MDGLYFVRIVPALYFLSAVSSITLSIFHIRQKSHALLLTADLGVMLYTCARLPLAVLLMQSPASSTIPQIVGVHPAVCVVLESAVEQGWWIMMLSIFCAMIMLWSTVNGYDPLSVHSPERQNHERLLAASNIICATLMVLWGHARSLEQVAEDCSLGAERYLNSSKIGAAYFRIGINFFQALGMIAITLHLSSKQIKNHRTISVTRRQSGLHQRSGKDALPSLVSPAAQSIGRMMFMSIMFVVFVAFNMIPDVKFALSGGVVEPSITAFQIGQRISPGALVGICLFLILGTTEKSRTYYLPPLRRMARFLHLLPPRSPSVCSSSLNPATQQYSNNTIPRSIRGRSPSDLDSSRKASLVHASRRPSMAVIQQRERSGADLLTVSDSAHASASLGASTAVPAGVGARRKSANLSLGLDAIPAFAGGEDRPAVLASVVFSTSPLTTPKGDIGDEEKRLGWTAPVVTPGRGRSGSSGGDSETGRERSSSGSKGSSAG